MDFHGLIAKMTDLSKPLTESEIKMGECGMDSTPTPPHSPPTMSVSLNANGLDDISSLMRLLVKVNPDMMPKDDKGPTLAADPNILTISNNHPEPLKMLPEPKDLDGDEDDEGEEDESVLGDVGGVIGGALGTAAGTAAGAISPLPGGAEVGDVAGGYIGNKAGEKAGEFADKKFNDLLNKFGSSEKETEEDIDGGFQSANTSNKDTKNFDTDKLIGKSNGLDKEKIQYKHSYKQGDNPMGIKKSITDSIKLDLQQRLAEIKAK